MSSLITRRALVAGAASGAGLLLSGCDQVIQNSTVRDIIFKGDDIHRTLQTALTRPGALATEFRPDQMSPVFRANGTLNPGGAVYSQHVAEKFANWRLEITGMVNRPLRLSLAQLRSMPQRAQITRHDCVEGWSAIGKWQGPMLGEIMKLAGLQSGGRHVIIHCADLYRGTNYYESLDMFDVFHPQTILAWQMNDAALSVPHGAPVRLRAERHLGYKQAKYVMGIEAVATLANHGLGQGGYWEDNVDYDTYAGI